MLADIEAKAVTSAQALQQVNAQMAAAEREKRMLQLTQTELNSYKNDTNVYVGVGKMYVIVGFSLIQVYERRPGRGKEESGQPNQ